MVFVLALVLALVLVLVLVLVLMLVLVLALVLMETIWAWGGLLGPNWRPFGLGRHFGAYLMGYPFWSYGALGRGCNIYYRLLY
jgi:hypothetical protein